MTIIKKSDSSEQYRITLSEYKKIKDISDNAVLSDYALLYDNNGVICLIAHSNETHNAIMYYGEWRTLDEVARLVRQELHINQETFIIIRVFCCNGATINGYYDNNTLILSAFNNKSTLNMSYNTFTVSFTDIEIA